MGTQMVADFSLSLVPTLGLLYLPFSLGCGKIPGEKEIKWFNSKIDELKKNLLPKKLKKE